MRSAFISLIFDVMRVPKSPILNFTLIMLYMTALASFLYWLFIIPLRNVKYFADDDDQLALAILMCIMFGLLCTVLDLDLLGWISVSLITFRFLQGKWIGPLKSLSFIKKLKVYADEVNVCLIALSKEMDSVQLNAKNIREEIQSIKAVLRMGKQSILVGGPFFVASLTSTLCITGATSLCLQMFLFVNGKRQFIEVPLVMFGNIGIALLLQFLSISMVFFFCDAVAMRKFFSRTHTEKEIEEANAHIAANCTAENRSVLRIIFSITVLAAILALGVLTYIWWYIDTIISN